MSKQRRVMTGTISTLTWTEDAGRARVKIRPNDADLTQLGENAPFQCALGGGILSDVYTHSAIGHLDVAHNEQEAESILGRDDAVRFEGPTAAVPTPGMPDQEAIRPVPLDQMDWSGSASGGDVATETLDEEMRRMQDAHNEGRGPS